MTLTVAMVALGRHLRAAGLPLGAAILLGAVQQRTPYLRRCARVEHPQDPVTAWHFSLTGEAGLRQHRVSVRDTGIGAAGTTTRK